MAAMMTPLATRPAPETLVAHAFEPTRRGDATAYSISAGADPFGDAAGYATVDAAVVAAQSATKGNAVGAAGVLERDGRFYAAPLMRTPDHVPFSFEGSRAASIVHQHMKVHDTGLRAVVDGATVELLPDYTAATTEAWRDLQLGTYTTTRAGSSRPTITAAYADQRQSYASKKTPFFTPVGAAVTDAVRTGWQLVRHDSNRQPVLLMRDAAGQHYVTELSNGFKLLNAAEKGDQWNPTPKLASFTPNNDAVVGIIGNDGWIDLSQKRTFPESPLIPLAPRPRP